MFGIESDLIHKNCKALYRSFSSATFSLRSKQFFHSLIMCQLLLVFSLQATAQQTVDFDVSHRVIRQDETLTCTNMTAPNGVTITG